MKMVKNTNTNMKSVLVKKIEGDANFGARMPQGGAALSSVKIQNIKNWINKGAKNN